MGLAGKYVPQHLKDNIRRFHQKYDYAQHGVKTGRNAQLVEQLELTEYFGTGLTQEIVEASLKELHEGAREAQRDPAELEVWWGGGLQTAHRPIARLECWSQEVKGR